jgi:hypothetical protein
MKHVKILLLIFPILFSSICLGQTAKDTATSLVTIQQLKISNLAFNELDKMIEVNRQQDSLIWTKQSRIELLKYQVELRTKQVEDCNSKLIQQEKDLQKAQNRAKLFTITAFLLGSITTILLLY